MDFMQDTLAYGRQARVLTLLDFSRPGKPIEARPVRPPAAPIFL